MPVARRDALRILAATRTWRGGRYHALFVLAIATGMRQGELFGLRWDDVDLAGTITVRRTVQTESEATVAYGTPKGGKPRTIQIAPAVVDVLAQHRKILLEERVRALAWEDARLVFVCPGGKVMLRYSFMEQYQKLLEELGLEHYTFHELRHICATLLREDGVDIRTVQDMLGHADVRLTLNLYSHVTDRMTSAAAAAISRMLEEGQVLTR